MPPPRLHRAWSRVTRFVPEGAALLSALIFGSYLLGLVRDRAFARTFGAGAELDAYNAAFVLPELLLDVLVEAGLAAPFIPIFLQLRSEGDGREGDRFARTILTGAVTIMGVAAIAMFVFAEQTTALIAPGFDAGQRDLYVRLFRVMLVTPILFAASLTLGQVLLAEQRFFWYGLAPLLYNVGIILGTVAFSDALGIFGPAIGALIGAVLHLASRFVGLRRSSFRIGLGRGFRMPAVREFVRLMLPKTASQPVEPMTFLFFTSVATTLAAGSVSAISFARNFQSVPVSLIGVAFALAVFPSLSTAHAEGDRPSFLRLLRTNLVSITVLTVAAAIGLAVVGGLAIRVLLGGGSFDAEDVAITSSVLAAFAISVPFESLAHLLSRAIYATRHTLLQVLASLAGLGITVLATQLLLGELAIVAIPIGFAVGQAAKVGLLGLALAIRLRGWRPT
ncbi:MAG: murein biosynthesis integral membrane protein MurJ [Chloroflexi bacterium]|nr:murein biosynthesis integral membrane protein MurJ [Chloroflexota bacterium]